MQIKYIVLLACTILVFITITGCDELEDKPDYKNVEVMTIAKVTTSDQTIQIPDMEIRLEIIKSGAVKKTSYVTTNPNGASAIVTHTVKLYKEQNVQVVGNLLSTLPQAYLDQGYTVYTYKSQTLNWQTVDQAVDWGEKYLWTPDICFTVSTS